MISKIFMIKEKIKIAVSNFKQSSIRSQKVEKQQLIRVCFFASLSEKIIPITVLSLAFSFAISAQPVMPGFARVGAKGIFVFVGDQVSNRTGEITAYRIERKTLPNGDFSEAARLEAVSSVSMFKKNMEASANWVPYKMNLDQYRVDSIWTRMKQTGDLSSLQNTGLSLPVMAGFNMAWLDTKVEVGKAYQYRITAIGTNEISLSSELIFNSPGVTKPRIDRFRYNQVRKTLEIYSYAKGENKPVQIEVFRSEERNKGYVQVPVKTGFFSPQPDSIQYHIWDSTALPAQMYWYYVKGYDVLGNASAFSDTLSYASLDFIQMPLPKQISVQADNDAQGIHFSWQLDQPELINMLTLYRSTNSVNGFQPIAVLAPDQLKFTDENLKPATAYFYYFEVVYKTQERPKRTTSFAGSFTSNKTPQQPVVVTAEGVKEGVSLQWENHEENISGFWLYRAEQGKPLQLISGPIPAVDTIRHYTFTDTDSLLSGGKFYQYALKSYSTSHLESIFSDTATARPLRNIPVPHPPLQINTNTDGEAGKVWVLWEDVSKYDEMVMGYMLLRQKNSSEKKHKTDTIFCSVNFYVDTLVKQGESYAYTVVSQSILGMQSVHSETVVFSAGKKMLPPPSLLLATTTKQGVLLQWEPPANADALRYNIYRYERGKAPVKTGTAVAGSSFTDKTAVKGKLYFYSLRSLDGGQESEKSNEMSLSYQ